MKLLPCSSRSCANLGGLFPPSRAYPNGEPAVSGQFVERYKCYRCKKPTDLTPRQWHGLPTLKLEDFESLAKRGNAPKLAELPLRDFMANGMSKEQAAEAFRAGFLDTLQAEKAGPPREVEKA